ncbi:MAG TPA: hypothetical protein VK668_01875 [Mucilaginibacter sp.]|nr:hypothetical protein [Mucilaginibacter sp.]
MQVASENLASRSRESSSFCLPTKKKPTPGCCINIGANQPVEYPDPAIYSQAEQLNLGNIPNWDNPDIVTNNWSPFRLMSESQVTVHNLSPSASAINTLVHFYTSPFGIGTVKTLLASKVVSLPPGSQTLLTYPLPQDTLAGDQRIGVHVKIEHPTDNNYMNNEGSQVHDGSYTTESGRNFTLSIPVVNNSNFTRQILLSIMPTDLIATITNANHNFAPYEQIIAQLHIEVPAFLVGTPAAIIERAVTVVGRLAGGELVGGATKLLRINN